MPEMTERNAQVDLAIKNPRGFVKEQVIGFGVDVWRAVRVVLTTTVASGIMLLGGIPIDWLLTRMASALRANYAGFAWFLDHVQMGYLGVVVVFFAVDTVRNLFKLSTEPTPPRKKGANK